MKNVCATMPDRPLFLTLGLAVSARLDDQRASAGHLPFPTTPVLGLQVHSPTPTFLWVLGVSCMHDKRVSYLIPKSYFRRNNCSKPSEQIFCLFVV